MNPKEFEELTPEKQAEVFHHAPFKERGELLAHSENPGELIRSLSGEELYLMTRGADIDERAEMIKHASLPQLFFVSDIDCWQRDIISVPGFITWLEVLAKADERKMLVWLLSMDYEMIVAGLQKFVQVIKPEHEYAIDEVLGDAPYFTLDYLYYISVQEESLGTVRRAFEVLFENHKGRYFAILEGIISEMSNEIEEEAYHQREIRLSDHGFGDPETAFKIYRPLSQEEFDRVPPKYGSEPADEGRRAGPVPDYPVIWSLKKILIDEVFDRLKNEPVVVRDGVREEFAWLSNKVLSCEGLDFSSEDKVKEAVERARGILNFSLELLTDKDAEKAVRLVREKWLEHIFRWGVSRLIHLREEAKTVVSEGWDGNAKSFIEFLNEPFRTILTGLWRRCPECYDVNIKGDVELLRDFTTREDVERTELSVRQVTAVLEFLRDKISRNPYAALTKIYEPEALHLYPLLGTIFIRYAQSHKIDIKPLNDGELRAFLREGTVQAQGRKVIRKDWKENFTGAFFDSQTQEVLRSFWGLFFDALEEDLGHLEADQNWDTRFTAGFYLKG